MFKLLLTAALAATALAAPAPVAEPRTITTVVVVSTMIVVDPQGHTLSDFGKTTPTAVATTTAAATAAPEATTPVVNPPSSDGADPLDFYAPVGDEHYPGAQWGAKWARKIVAQHNIHRINHTNGRVRWDADLAANAFAWANQCKFHHDNTASSGNWTSGTYGQNMVTAGEGFTNPGATIAEAWYNGEYARYVDCSENFTLAQPKEPKDGGEYLHLSQLLWRDTTQIGCAVVDCSKREGGLQEVSENTVQNMMVCNYGQWGNYANEYAKNVPYPSLKFPVVRGDFISDL